MSWLEQKENYQWLDFGSGTQLLQAGALKMMSQRETHCIRTFAPDPDAAPIGIVALSNVSRNFKTAMLWYVLGEKQDAGRGHTTRAVHEILQLGFGTLGLRAINAWTVASNTASIRVLERNNFQLSGRLRESHYVDSRVFDRLLFDLLASEHGGISERGGIEVSGRDELAGQLIGLFAEQLQVEVPSAGTDLIEAGLLDSVKLVELLVQLERRFGVSVDLTELELDHFRSVQGIAALVAQRKSM